ncbi:ABC transporter permease [Arthrobacter sp. 92]|uniref:ABC transporter permease n=1 Tax=Arthrobacter sp. 92 TaxID=3418175 RepID=UPI003D01BBAC
MSTKTITLPAVHATSRTRGTNIVRTLVRDFALLPVIAVILIVGGIINPAFLTAANFTNIGLQSAALGVVVVAESIILISGGMDLSLQSTYGLAPMVGAWFIAPAVSHGLGTELHPVVGLVITLLVGAAVGVFNGVMVSKAKMNGFILTLAMYILLAGLQTGLVSGQTIYELGPVFTGLGTQSILGIPSSVLLAVAIFAAAGLYMRYTQSGRAIYAIGGNRDAARAAGIRVDRIRIGVYVVAGVLAALGGIMEAGRVQAVASNQGVNLIFTVFAAAVIGGVSLNGGKGSIIGAATGVVLLALVVNLLTLQQVQSYWIAAVNGLVILIALGISRILGGESAD